ncbi:MAG: hypothetical protein AAFP19_16970, partial [Bacteroidota bacterium]
MKNRILCILTLSLLGLSQMAFSQTDTWKPAKYDTGESTYRIGSVGIGTPFPGSDLHIYNGPVEGPIGNEGNLGLNTATTSTLRLEAWVSDDASYPQTNFESRAWNFIGGNSLDISSNLGNIMRMTKTGKVGIGVTSVRANLHVAGSIMFQDLANSEDLTEVLVADGEGLLKQRKLGDDIWDGDNDEQELSLTGT